MDAPTRPDANFETPPIGYASNLGFSFIIPTEEDFKTYREFTANYESYSEMSEQDRIFLSSLVSQNKPQKILELGVSHGGSSVVILNAIKNDPTAELYSIDYKEFHYRLKDKRTGYFVDNFPELKNKWHLYTGGLALNFLDKISSSDVESEKFDLCLLDTVHSAPGEILDFLQVFPYLKKNAIVVLHDTNLQLYLDNNLRRVDSDINNILMSSINGEKYIPSPHPNKSFVGYFFNNIGAIKLSNVNIYNIFNLLTLKWRYMPQEKDLNEFKMFLQRFYDKYYCEYFEQVIATQKYLNDYIKYHN